MLVYTFKLLLLLLFVCEKNSFCVFSGCLINKIILYPRNEDIHGIFYFIVIIIHLMNRRVRNGEQTFIELL